MNTIEQMQDRGVAIIFSNSTPEQKRKLLDELQRQIQREQQKAESQKVIQ